MNYRAVYMDHFNNGIDTVDQTNFNDFVIFLEKTKLKLINSYLDNIREKKVEWVQEKHVSVCDACYDSFSLTKRKHHCRACGNVFCDNCTKNKKPIPVLGYLKPVRHCSNCFYNDTFS